MKFNTRYNLRKQDSKKPEKIYLICRWNGEKFVYPTDFNVLPKYWNTKAGEIRNVIEIVNRDYINDYLRKLKATAKNIYEHAVIARTPITKSLLKDELDKWTGKTVIEKPVFNLWLRKYIDDSTDRINPRTGRVISYRTIQEYNTTFDYLQEFEKSSRQKLDFDTITVRTLADFRDYLTRVKKFSINNIAKHIDNLRQFLRAASAEKIVIDLDTVNPRMFTVAREAPEDVYLNEDELKAITDLDLSQQPTHDRVRDLFLIGCYTGLRVSDFNNIKPHQIKGEFIDLYQHKTGGRVVIPIHNTVKAILSKYGGATPPKISDQKLNTHIKEICQKAGISEQIEKQQTKAGARMVSISEKWNLVTSHTARRSFATNMTKQGVPIQSIMKITGHKKESVFLKYVKLTAMEHAEIIRKHLKGRDASVMP